MDGNHTIRQSGKRRRGNNHNETSIQIETEIFKQTGKAKTSTKCRWNLCQKLIREAQTTYTFAAC